MRPAAAIEAARPSAEDIARGVHEVAQLLERGQATTPLSDLARSAMQPATTAFRLALAGDDPERRQAVLEWLVGTAAAAPLADLPWPAGALLQLQPQGFALQMQGAPRSEFADPGAFTDALRGLLATQDGPGSATGLRLQVPASSSMPLDLMLLPPTAQWTEVPDALATLAAHPTILLDLGTTAAPAPGVPQGLLPEPAAVWPVVQADEAPRNDRALPGVPRLPAARPGQPLPWVSSQGHALSNAWRDLVHARGLADLVEAALERLAEDAGRLRARLKREQRVERGSEAEVGQAQLRSALDTARVKAIEDLGQLTAMLREHARRALQRSGTLGQALHALAARVQPDDLVREEAGKVVRLQLDPRQVAGLEGRLAAACRQLLDDQCSLVRDTFELVRRRTEEALQAAGARNLGVPLPPPDAEPLWQALREGVKLDLRYRGEIARRGWMQRLGAGRQTVFAVLMLLSLIGGFVGFNVRQAAFAGIILLVLFIGAVAWTYRSWRDEDRLTLEREMEKVRDGVLSELERLTADVARDLQARLQELLDGARRDFLGRLDTALREAQADAGALAEAQRREARARIKVIEQRDKDLAGAASTLSKLRSSAAQHLRDTQRRWAEACQAIPE